MLVYTLLFNRRRWQVLLGGYFVEIRLSLMVMLMASLTTVVVMLILMIVLMNLIRVFGRRNTFNLFQIDLLRVMLHSHKLVIILISRRLSRSRMLITSHVLNRSVQTPCVVNVLIHKTWVLRNCGRWINRHFLHRI